MDTGGIDPLFAAVESLRVWRGPSNLVSGPEMRLDITTPPTTDPVSLAISPDGQKIDFVATSQGRTQLWLRPLDSASAHPLAGTDYASAPFWSPDSHSLAFFAEGKLRRIDLDSGFVQFLARAIVPAGGAWNQDGMILFPIVDRIGWIYLSSLYMLNPAYRRDYDEAARSAGRWTQEIAACLLVWTVAYLWWVEIIPASALFKTYLVFLAWIGANQVRTLTAHKYGLDGETSSHVQQMLDSNTFANGWILPELWAPVGLRYHALHHVLPSLPYHAMGDAHRRLMQCLPTDSPYRQTLQSGLWAAIVASFVGPPTANTVGISTEI